ncbi:MAG: pyridoxamine 5'-phosphate oxidase family protein [Candidatus Omnitrophota bacterium]
MRLPQEVIDFFENQGFVIVSTLDRKGLIHNSCKGIVAIKKEGWVYLLDLYRGNTYRNLIRNPVLSITAVDEQRFKGYTLKGKADLLKKDNLGKDIIKLWDTNIAKRVTKRIIRALHGQKGHSGHPEANLPSPKYLIRLKVEEIIDLSSW